MILRSLNVNFSKYCVRGMIKMSLKSSICETIVGIYSKNWRCSLTSPFEQLEEGGSDGKESACNAGDLGSTPGSGRSSVEGIGYPLKYACLESSIDRGTWQDTVHGVAKDQTRLSN